MKKIASLLVVIGLVWLAVGCAKTQQPTSQKPEIKKPAPSKPGATKQKDNRKLVTMKIKDFAFEPAEIKVGVNDIVDWENQDGAEHSVHADDDSWQSKPLAQGDHFEKSFKQPGTYTYHCHIHPTTMKGKIIVE